MCVWQRALCVRPGSVLGTRKHAGVCVNKMALEMVRVRKGAAQTTHTFIADIINILSCTS